MPFHLASKYKSPSQQARVVTEAWATRELYCVNCLDGSLDPAPINFQAIDYFCSHCRSPFQLKSSKSGIGAQVPDGSYQAMITAIREDRTPNLLLLSYKQTTWEVLDLLLIPNFAFSEQAIIPRKPLGLTARRAGWVGCNINLRQIAPDARIPIILGGQAVAPWMVSRSYTRLKPLAQLDSKERNWALAVLNAIQIAGWTEFTTNKAYVIEDQLKKLYPLNHNIRPKIRQQLQVLRDMGLLKHLSRGSWQMQNNTNLDET